MAERFKFICMEKQKATSESKDNDISKRGGAGIPDLKLYYEANVLNWINEWIRLRNEKLLNLEGFDNRFGWHAYLWYDKAAIHKDFSHHLIRRSLLKIWENIKNKTFREIPLWVSSQEAFFFFFFGRWKDIDIWLTYKDILFKLSNNTYKMKPIKNLKQSTLVSLYAD